MTKQAKPRKRLTREESDGIRVDQIAQQFEEQEQQELIERLYERAVEREEWARFAGVIAVVDANSKMEA